jgi:hypothetical protein
MDWLGVTMAQSAGRVRMAVDSMLSGGGGRVRARLPNAEKTLYGVSVRVLK